jgi:hypothetical protein
MMDQLQTAAVGFGLIAAGVWNGWLQVKTRRDAKATKKAAEQAAEHAYPISNGWGTALREDMAKTLRAVERIGEAQLIAERRELARDDRLRSIDGRLAEHIEHHGQETAA